jgi:hypothetical protein
MLNKAQMNSYYRDPYLQAVLRESGLGTAVGEPWFYGYETAPRPLVLKKSGIHIQCVDQGWEVSEAPTEPTQKTAFDQVCSKYRIGQSGLCAVPQHNGIDTKDRVMLGAQLLRDLANAGL